MCVSVNINGGQTPHTVTVERKASKRCICQVFYHREGVNCWKITFALFLEHLLAVSNILCLMTAIMCEYDNGENLSNPTTSFISHCYHDVM